MRNDPENEKIHQLLSKYNQKIIDEFVEFYYPENKQQINKIPILYFSLDWGTVSGGKIPVLWISSYEEFWYNWNKFEKLWIFK